MRRPACDVLLEIARRIYVLELLDVAPFDDGNARLSLKRAQVKDLADRVRLDRPARACQA